MALFYRSKNFAGTSYTYNVGLSSLGINNNQISSIKLTGTTYFIAYDGINYTGNSMVIADDIADLSLYGFDKRIRSIRVGIMPTPSFVYSRSYDAVSSFHAYDASDNLYSCSGFFVSANGYFVTAAHCVLSDVFNQTTQRYDPLMGFYISVSNVNQVAGVNKVFSARLVGYDVSADVAVLKVDGLTNQQFLTWGKSRQTPIGSKIYIIGNPRGRDEDTIASGIVRDNRYNGDFPTFYAESVITDATILAGNSGGPLLNIIGQVVGLSNYGITGSSNQFGGGVSQFIAEPIVSQLIAFDMAGRPQRSLYNASDATLTVPTQHKFILNDGSRIQGALGAILIQIPKYYLYEANINNLNYKGAIVDEIMAGSPIDTYLNPGDIILTIDGFDLGMFQNQFTPHSLLFGKLPGETVSIQYLRLSEGYTTIRTQVVALTRYPNDASIFSDIMKVPNDSSTKTTTTQSSLDQKLRNYIKSMK